MFVCLCVSVGRGVGGKCSNDRGWGRVVCGYVYVVDSVFILSFSISLFLSLSPPSHLYPLTPPHTPPPIPPSTPLSLSHVQVFEGLFAGTVPVYRGAASISRFMPADDSFINANNMTAAELAQLLHSYAGTTGTSTASTTGSGSGSGSGTAKAAAAATTETATTATAAGSEYAKFFSFQHRPLSASFSQIALMSYTHPTVLCRLCDYALSQQQPHEQ
jgi:hypothetical protein